MMPMWDDQGKKKRNVISNMGNTMWIDLEPVVWSEMESGDLTWRVVFVIDNIEKVDCGQTLKSFEC